MKLLLFCGILYCVYKIISGLRQRSEKERDRKDKEEIKAELAVQKAQIQAEIERAKLETKRQIEAEKSRLAWQKRQDEINRKAEADRIRLAKEQQRQAAQLERHEEMLMKLDHRLASAESEIAFNREQIERLFRLQKMEQAERDRHPYGSAEWQKHEKKVISLENQIHTFQKRIDKAKADKRFCESKLA